MVTKWLLLVSVLELYNSIVSPPEEVGIQEARDEENNIIIIDFTPCDIFPLQLNNISA